jgi:putative Holliday junction resolvase
MLPAGEERGVISMRIMALDMGEKRIGVAVSDELLLTAQGLCVVDSRGVAKDLVQIADLAEKEHVTLIVIGLPRNMNGSRGPKEEKAREFGRLLLEKQPDVPVDFWDERLTTAAARRMLVDADMSRARRRQVVDKVAAVLILQGYMDFIARKRFPARD